MACLTNINCEAVFDVMFQAINGDCMIQQPLPNPLPQAQNSPYFEHLPLALVDRLKSLDGT